MADYMRECRRGHLASADRFSTRRATCRDCIADDRRQQRTPERLDIVRAKLEKLQRACRAILNEIKSHPCTDCNRCFPPVCMQFDHRDYRTKGKTVSAWCAAGLLRQMLAEIELCDLVCANCHAIRGAARRLVEGFRGGRPRKYPLTEIE